MGEGLDTRLDITGTEETIRADMGGRFKYPGRDGKPQNTARLGITQQSKLFCSQVLASVR